MQAFEIRASLEEGYQPCKPVRSARYLAFIRKQASVVSGYGPCDPCHTGPHGGNQKSSDLSAIPLTRREHDRFDVDPRAFAESHGLDIPNLILKFTALFQSDGGIF